MIGRADVLQRPVAIRTLASAMMKALFMRSVVVSCRKWMIPEQRFGGETFMFGPLSDLAPGIPRAKLHRIMRRIRTSMLGLALVIAVIAGSVQRAGSPPTASVQSGAAVTGKVVAAANAFLATLSASERAKVAFDFNSRQKTSGWSNLPTGAFQR